MVEWAAAGDLEDLLNLIRPQPLGCSPECTGNIHPVESKHACGATNKMLTPVPRAAVPRRLQG